MILFSIMSLLATVVASAAIENHLLLRGKTQHNSACF